MVNRKLHLIGLVLILSALGLASVRPAYAQPAAPTLTLNPAAVAGKVNAMTVAFKVSWAAGWDGSVLSSQLSSTSGHVHFMIDGNPPAMHFAAAGAISTQRSFSFTTGNHTVAVELVNPNHMPYDPQALTSTSFQVTITEEGQRIIDSVQQVSNNIGALTGLVYGVLGLSIVAIVVGAIAVSQARSLKKTALR